MYDVSHLENNKHIKGKTWGWIPPTQEIYDAFHHVRDVVNPKTMLEIGFYKGHSTSYWAQTLPECEIVSCGPPHMNYVKWAPVVREEYSNVVDIFPYKSPQIWHELFLTLNCERNEKGHTKKYDKFDFVFIDGNHSYQNALLDTTLAVDILGANWVMYDNHEFSSVKQAIETYGKLKLEQVFPYTCDMYEKQEDGKEIQTISNLELALYCRI